jgi:hypothetical protein
LSALIWEQQVAGWSTAAAALDGLDRAPDRAGAPTPAPICLDVTHGQQVTIPFLVQNQYDRCVDVSFAADPPTTAAGAPVPASTISFEPRTLALPPGGQLVVRATVAVTEDFTEGQVYATALHVRDLPAPPLPVELRVGPAEPSDG